MQIIREERINRLGRYWKKRYGEKVYKIILNGDFTCPNIKKSTGCIFCNMSSMKTVIEKETGFNQADNNQSYVQNRNNVNLFYAYFQDYSATYPREKENSLLYLEKLYRSAFELENVVGVSIGTRADAVDDKILSLLFNLKKEYKKDVLLEIGLQSIVKEDLIWMNRGHSLQIYLDTIKKIKEHNLEVVSHLILGLPHETEKSIVKTAHLINELSLNGIKLHQLMVLKETHLETLYQKGKIRILSQDVYLNKLKLFLGNLEKKIVVHRLYGDAPKDSLIAPLWCLNKTGLQDIILNDFVKTDFWQGKYL